MHTFDHHFQQKKLGFLMNLILHLKLPNKIKGRPHLEKGGTRSKRATSITPQQEETPRRQLRSSKTKQKQMEEMYIHTLKEMT
jgi:hypothetical protein